MKKLFFLIAVTTAFTVLTPTMSQARDNHHSAARSVSHSCRFCGSAVYRERAITGYDRHGHPVYGYRTLSHHCRSDGRRSNSRGHGSGQGGHISTPGFHMDFGGRERH